MPGQCIVCVKPICTRIQRRGEYQECCCPSCHYQNKREVLVGRDEETSDPAEESDEFSQKKSEDSDDFYYRQTWLSAGDDGFGPTTHQPIQFGSANFPCEGTWKQTKEEI